MVKTRTAAKPARADVEQESTDGLEVISIGSLYNGPWEKKYWSSSRGKDRYPYPVGYQAVRAHNGTTYKMEILEGVNGPNFLITSDDGNLASGKTPDFAWEEFQKKGFSRIKIWHGKRLSSKMDGLELFGFKNPFIQRLLRELVADINGTAERSLVSSNSCNEVPRTDHGGCPPNVGSYPNLLLNLGKSHVTGKRSRCDKNKILNGRSRPRFIEHTCNTTSEVKNEMTLGQGHSTTHNGSEEENATHNQTDVSPLLQIMSSVGKISNCISSKNQILLNPVDISKDEKVGTVPSERLSGFLFSANCKTAEITENMSTGKPLHRSHDVELKVSSSLVTTEDKKPMQSCLKDSQGCIGIDHCAPDSLDLIQEVTEEITPDSAPSRVDKNAFSDPACEAVSKDVLNPEHEEVIRSHSNPSSKKSGFISAGHDVTKSMMSLLLPLLENVSTDEGIIISSSDAFPSRVTNTEEEQNEVGYALDVPSSDKVVIEDAYEGQGEKIHGASTHSCSNTPNIEHAKSIVPDSFEYSQCEDFKTSEIISFDVTEAGRSSFNEETFCLKSKEPLRGCDLPNGSFTCNASELDFENRPRDCDACIPDSVLDDTPPEDRMISEQSKGVCSDLKENPVHVSFNSMQDDQSNAQDFTGGISNAFSGVKTKNCHLNITETLAEKTQDEAVGKTGNAETMIMSSSQSPKLVYTRRKLRKAVPLQGNRSIVESIESDKIELVTPEMHAAKGTCPPSKNIQINNLSDKICEPEDSAGLLVETPQTHSEVLGGQGNLVELNPSSSKNLNPTACENKCSGAKETQFSTELMPHKNWELKNKLKSNVKFLGCYVHPMPVSSLLLKTREDGIDVCVLCGFLIGQYRTLFTYKVAIKEPSLGYPSVMAHTSIQLPDQTHNFIRENMVERSGVQLTPDGKYIILIGSIKTPNCRVGKFDCCCSTCTSVCSEKNALKIVQVERGYVSIVATLEAVEDVHCILACEPNRLVSVGESGRLQVWVMNSTWSDKIEYSIIPAGGSMSPGIVELKRVPKCAHLVVGRTTCGEFSLWDITKLTCISSFSASKYPIDEFFPVSLFNCQTEGSGFGYANIEENADKLLEATNLWHSEQRETCSVLPSEEDAAMWILVSTASDVDHCQSHVSTSSHCDIHIARSWRLALLAKNGVVFGSLLDPRTIAIGVLGGYGIISTSDGLVYMWELSRGSKLDNLHHFQDGTVTCLATDDSNPRGALGVAGGGGQLLLYLHLNERDSKE